MVKAKAKKSFKKYARKHLAREIKTRKVRKQIKREKTARVERRTQRVAEEGKKEEEAHQATIQNIKEHDPEFHKYAEQNDPELLKFTDGDIANQDDLSEEEDGDESDVASEVEMQRLEEMEDLEGSEVDDDAGETERYRDARHNREKPITMAEIEAWIRLRRLKPLTFAFRQAVITLHHPSDLERDKWNPITPDLAEGIVIAVMKSAASIMDYHLGRQPSAKGQTKLPIQCEKYGKVSAFVRVIANMGLRAVRFFSDPAILTILMTGAIGLVPYMVSLKRVGRRFLRRALTLVLEPEETLRFQAFLFIREVARVFPYPYVDACMKGLFLTLVKHSRKFGRQNLQLIAFLMNCVVVLWGEDLETAYQQGFMYIRQLAMYLRVALKNPSEENFQPVYNWQYINTFRVLAMVVCQYVKPNQLWPLVYPLCQVGTGVIDLFPSPKCYPLHLNMIGILNRISKASGVYIPVPPYILRILGSPEFKKKYKKSATELAPDLICMLRVRTPDFKQLIYQQAVFTEALFYLAEHLSLHAHTIGFPELAYPSVREMRALKKSLSRIEWKDEVTALAKEIEKNVDFIRKKRETVDFGPKDSDRIALFESEIKTSGTPLNTYFTDLHAKRSQQLLNLAQVHAQNKRKLLEDVLGEEVDGRRRGGRGGDEDDDVPGLDDVDSDAEDNDDDDDVGEGGRDDGGRGGDEGEGDDMTDDDEATDDEENDFDEEREDEPGEFEDEDEDEDEGELENEDD